MVITQKYDHQLRRTLPLYNCDEPRILSLKISDYGNCVRNYAFLLFVLELGHWINR